MSAIQLNKEQQKVVDSIDGPVAVYAGPGSGKTRVLIERIKKMVLEKNIDPGSILAITFTNKAAAEMKKRLSKYIEPKKLFIGTFHSFCYEALKHFYNVDFKIMDEEHSITLMKDVAKQNGIDFKISFYFEITKAKDEGKGLQKSEIKTKNDRNRYSLYKKYQEYLLEYHLMDFAEIMMKFSEQMDEDYNFEEFIQNKFRYIMVDEYQDTNKLQYNIVSRMAKKYNNLFVVGDSDQSIYAFRGADINNILSFDKNYPSAVNIRLEENYRSLPTIIKAGNNLITNNKNRIDKTVFTRKKEEGIIEIIKGFGWGGAAKKTAEYIKENLDFQNTAILFRINFHNELLKKELFKLKVPVAGEELDFSLEHSLIEAFATNEKNLIMDVFEEKLNLDSRTRSRIFKTHKENIFEICEEITLPPVFKKEIKELEKTFEKAKMVLPKERLKLLLELVPEYKTKNQVHELIFKELENGFIVSNDISESFSKLSFMINEKHKAPGVHLMTLHKSKGLEFENVFLFGLNEGNIPHSMGAGTKEGLEEERRLCYVGITRAEKNLFIVKNSILNDSMFEKEMKIQEKNGSVFTEK